ncbi:MAG: GDSL-type esterase/lipase family protein [Lachnotalea sp.]
MTIIERINQGEVTKEELISVIEQFGVIMKEQQKGEQLKKVRNYKELNKVAVKQGVLFTGSSLMEQFPINEYCMSGGITKMVYNRGIGGTTTDDFLREIDTVLFDLEPEKVFINIGTNDINKREDNEPWQEHLLKNYEEILKQLIDRLPQTEVYMMAYYPVNAELLETPEWAKTVFATRTNVALNDTNEKVKLLAEKFNYHFIDLNDGIKDAKGNLRADITVEGMHMYTNGYANIFEKVKCLI